MVCPRADRGSPKTATGCFILPPESTIRGAPPLQYIWSPTVSSSTSLSGLYDYTPDPTPKRRTLGLVPSNTRGEIRRGILASGSDHCWRHAMPACITTLLLFDFANLSLALNASSQCAAAPTKYYYWIWQMPLFVSFRRWSAHYKCSAREGLLIRERSHPTALFKGISFLISLLRYNANRVSTIRPSHG